MSFVSFKVYTLSLCLSFFGVSITEKVENEIKVLSLGEKLCNRVTVTSLTMTKLSLLLGFFLWGWLEFEWKFNECHGDSDVDVVSLCNGKSQFLTIFFSAAGRESLVEN